MHDYGISAETEPVGGCLPVEDVLHVICREVHLAVSSVYEFGKAYLELFDLRLVAFEYEFVSAGYHPQAGEIAAEFLKYAVARTINLNRVYSFKRNRFFHL